MDKTEKTTAPFSLDSSPYEVPQTKSLTLPPVSPHIDHATHTFEHFLFAPIHYEPRYNYPLIVWLHSAMRDERELFHVMPSLSLRNYVAVAPRAPRVPLPESYVSEPQVAPIYDWRLTDTGLAEAEEAVFQTIERAQLECSISSKKIFLVGSGSGGTMALRLSSLYPERFAGAVSLMGSFPEDQRPLRNWKKLRSFPILITVGIQNRQYSPIDAARQLRFFHAAGMSVSIRQYKTGSELIPMIYRDVNHWLMERVVGQ